MRGAVGHCASPWLHRTHRNYRAETTWFPHGGTAAAGPRGISGLAVAVRGGISARADFSGLARSTEPRGASSPGWRPRYAPSPKPLVAMAGRRRKPRRCGFAGSLRAKEQCSTWCHFWCHFVHVIVTVNVAACRKRKAANALITLMFVAE